VFGDSKTWTPAVAALLNGALGHSLDFDDTHADSSLHPSAPVVPAAFAVGELTGASGRDVLTAIVAGYEVCCRLGNALDPTSHYARGFHPTATAGTYGAAAAAAKLFGLSKDQIIAAFGVSGSQAAGSLQFLVNGAWNKRYQVGAAAMNGVIAATWRATISSARPNRSRASTGCWSATATTPIPTRRSPVSARSTRP
jgi:2-methylcitrate dehydratase PrpD